MTQSDTTITRGIGRRSLLAAAALPALLSARPARAEVSQVRLSHGYGIHYLPLMLIRDHKLLEKHAAQLGYGTIETDWRIIDGGNVINDAMLAGALDIAGLGAPGFITLWSKAYNMPKSAVIGVAGLGKGALWLNTNKASIKTLRDFGPSDKIAVPGIKTSFAAVVLQMAAAKEFGMAHYDQLDSLTVSLGHPDALAALVSGKTEITGHVASPPFSNMELTHPNIHRVFSTSDFLGPITIDVVYASKRFADANPHIMEAFVAAMDEASAAIGADKDAAVDSFLRVSGVSMKKEAVRALLDDPETSFATAPEGVMAYANFLAATGSIKLAPKVWSDMFIPQLRDRKGS
jgi:NitT/TauT family transport system substrate-binding protein